MEPVGGRKSIGIGCGLHLPFPIKLPLFCAFCGYLVALRFGSVSGASLHQRSGSNSSIRCIGCMNEFPVAESQKLALLVSIGRRYAVHNSHLCVHGQREAYLAHSCSGFQFQFQVVGRSGGHIQSMLGVSFQDRCVTLGLVCFCICSGLLSPLAD